MDQNIKVGTKVILDDDTMPTTSDGEPVSVIPPLWYSTAMKMREDSVKNSLSGSVSKFMLCGSGRPLGSILEDADRMNFLIDTFGLDNKRPIIGVSAVEKSHIDELLKTVIETLTKDGPVNVIVIDSILGGDA